MSIFNVISNFFLKQLTVYHIRCVYERLSNIYNLLCEGHWCAGAREWAPRTLQ